MVGIRSGCIPAVLLTLWLHYGANAATNAQLSALGVLNVKAYGAVGNGVTDDTTAIQNAINAARTQAKVLLFPEGTYKVSDTLKLYKPDSESDRWNTFQWVGSTRGSRPVIKLVSSATKFNRTLGSVLDATEVSKVCPVIYGCAFYDDDNDKVWDFTDSNGNGIPDLTSEGEDPRNANTFFFAIRGIDFDVSGHSSAVAIWLKVAQTSHLEDIKITATNAWGGITGHPGALGVIGNIEVVGGRVGIHGKTQHSTGLNGITLKNQTEYAMVQMSEPRLITGFSIEKAAPPAIALMNGGYSPEGLDDLGLIDGTIKFTTSNSSPAIENPQGHAVYMHNVYFHKAGQIIKSGSRAAVTGNAAGWKRVIEYVNPDSRSGTNLINGVKDANQYVDMADSNEADVPANLVSRHIWNSRDFPSPDDVYDRIHDSSYSKYAPNDYAIITEEGCVADNTDANSSDCAGTDNRAALQALIDSGVKTILIPWGKFLVGKSPNGNYGIRLGEETVLMGISDQMSELRTLDTWKPTAQSSVVTTPDSAEATCKIDNLRLGIRNDPNDLSHSWHGFFNWKAGKNSMIRRTSTRSVWFSGFRTQPRAGALFSGNGGGRHFGVGGDGGQHCNDAEPFTDKANGVSTGGFRRILISGTSQPLAIYNTNMEDGCDNPQMEVLNASNVIIYGSKNENANPVAFKNSNNCAFINNGVASDHEVNNCTNTLMAMISSRHFSGPILTEIGGQTCTTAVGVFKRGTFDWSKVEIIPGDDGGGTDPDPKRVSQITENFNAWPTTNADFYSGHPTLNPGEVIQHSPIPPIGNGFGWGGWSPVNNNTTAQIGAGRPVTLSAQQVPNLCFRPVTVVPGSYAYTIFDPLGGTRPDILVGLQNVVLTTQQATSSDPSCTTSIRLLLRDIGGGWWISSDAGKISVTTDSAQSHQYLIDIGNQTWEQITAGPADDMNELDSDSGPGAIISSAGTPNFGEVTGGGIFVAATPSGVGALRFSSIVWQGEETFSHQWKNYF